MISLTGATILSISAAATGAIGAAILTYGCLPRLFAILKQLGKPEDFKSGKWYQKIVWRLAMRFGSTDALDTGSPTSGEAVIQFWGFIVFMVSAVLWIASAIAAIGA